MTRRVLFALSTPLSFAVVDPVAERLRDLGGIELFGWARHGGRRAVRDLSGGKLRPVGRLRSRFARFDTVVCPGYSFRAHRARTAVQMFHGVSPKNYAVREEARRFDRLFLIGPYHRRKFVRAGIFPEDDPRFLEVGMPKTDRLARRTGPRGAVGRPTVLYAPTRSGSGGNSLDLFGVEAIERIARLPVDVVVKLHDRSDPRFRRRLDVDWPRVLRERFAAAGVRLVEGGDVVDLMLEADVLVTDLSSVAGEFYLLDRPVVFLPAPAHEQRLRRSHAERFGEDDPEDLDWYLAGGERARDPASAARLVERALECPERLSDRRRERARELFYNPGRATESAVAALLSILEEGP